MLKGVRIIDLTARHGMLCGQIMSDLGADVVQLEAPGGAAGRSRGPFLNNQACPENSLSWAAWSRGKRSVVLDLHSAEGVATLRDLLASADMVIEDCSSDERARLGLGEAELGALNSRLIHVCITPYGLTGPKADWAFCDLTVLAAGGPLAVTGDSDRPPVRISVPQAFLHAAADAAVGALIALHHLRRTGIGQRVEVSAQESVTSTTQSNIIAEAIGDSQSVRRSGGGSIAGIPTRTIWPAADGYVAITHNFGALAGAATKRLMDVIHNAGFCDEATRDQDWQTYGLKLAQGRVSRESFEELKACIARFTASRTKAELLELALERKLLIAPVATISEMMSSDQALARGSFFRPADGGHLSGLRYPGPFARFAKSPLQLKRGAPSIGEHTAEILAELASSPRKQAPVTAAGQSSDLPLEGIRILDLSWAYSGPAATRMLGDYGATVVKVESSKRMDPSRSVRPFANGDMDPESAAVFHNLNAGKKLVSLDLTAPETTQVFLDLVRWADVICESFAPGVMTKLGFDYEALRAINPNVIMLSTSLMGNSGPLATFAGFGNLAAAITGFVEITGWPDRAPAGPYMAYTDYIGPRYIAAALLAAIAHREATGEGQHIELAQAETAMHFLAPALLDFDANAHDTSRVGNDDPEMVPHGVFPGLTADTWIAVACVTDEQWRTLCNLIGTIAEQGSRWDRLADRLKHREAISGLLKRWSEQRTVEESEQILQAAGVAASVVRNSRELLYDPQLLHAGHFSPAKRELGGRDAIIERTTPRLSRTPPRIDRTAPYFNRDLDFVLSRILEYDGEKISNLIMSGALE